MMPENLTAETALFPIGTVSEQTGVNTVTLRAWERRYGLLKPQRTPKGHRLYSQQDIDRVKQVLVLLKQGIAAGQVREALDSGMASGSGTSNQLSLSGKTSWQALHDHFIACINRLDSRTLSTAFNEVTRLYPLDIVADNLLLPLYRQISQQCQILPSTRMDLVFLHDFLSARLGEWLLTHNSPATRQHLLLGNFADTTGQLYTLLLANLLVSQGYKVTWLGSMQLDHLPLTFQRTSPEAVILVNAHQDIGELPAVATFLPAPVCLYAYGEQEREQDTPTLAGVHTLTGQLGDIPDHLHNILTKR